MRALLLAILMMSPAVMANDLPDPPEGKRWVPIDHVTDEFNGDSLDLSKWLPRHPYWSGRNSTHTESNISVRDGHLRLRSCLKPGATEVKVETVQAACVSTHTPRCLPGYYETRIKGSDISMTSAFWLQGEYTEIDVIENIGRPHEPNSAWVEDTMMINTHYFKDGWSKDIATPIKWKMPGSSTDFRVYGVWWQDEKTASFYHNGDKIGEATFGGPFDESQYLFFDTEVFTWHGWPTQESLLDESRNTMLVDWVRGWKLVDKN